MYFLLNFTILEEVFLSHDKVNLAINVTFTMDYLRSIIDSHIC
jgi:hypothetical protein